MAISQLKESRDKTEMESTEGSRSGEIIRKSMADEHVRIALALFFILRIELLK